MAHNDHSDDPWLIAIKGVFRNNAPSIEIEAPRLRLCTKGHNSKEAQQAGIIIAVTRDN
jgi:hypothetical protein